MIEKKSMIRKIWPKTTKLQDTVQQTNEDINQLSVSIVREEMKKQPAFFPMLRPSWLNQR